MKFSANKRNKSDGLLNFRGLFFCQQHNIIHNVRLVSSPDINTEDFCASVDYLVCLDNVAPERIGIKRGYHPRSINSGLGWNAYNYAESYDVFTFIS